MVAVSRRPEAQQREGVQALADVTDAAAVRHALEGVEVAYYLVHSLGLLDYAALDRRAAATVAREAEQAGVAQLMPSAGSATWPDLSPHLRSRRETAVALSSGSVPLRRCARRS